MTVAQSAVLVSQSAMMVALFAMVSPKAMAAAPKAMARAVIVPGVTLGAAGLAAASLVERRLAR